MVKEEEIEGDRDSNQEMERIIEREEKRSKWLKSREIGMEKEE